MKRQTTLKASDLEWLFVMLLNTVNRDPVWGHPAEALYLSAMTGNRIGGTESLRAVLEFTDPPKGFLYEWTRFQVADWSMIQASQPVDE